MKWLSCYLKAAIRGLSLKKWYCAVAVVGVLMFVTMSVAWLTVPSMQATTHILVDGNGRGGQYTCI